MAQTREEALQGVADQVEALQAVINGLPRVAEAIAAVAAIERSKALAAVEASFRQSALKLGYSDSQARDWVAAIMFSLRTQVHGRQSSKDPSLEGGPTLSSTRPSAA
jgi:hypothetical protein